MLRNQHKKEALAAQARDVKTATRFGRRCCGRYVFLPWLNFYLETVNSNVEFL